MSLVSSSGVPKLPSMNFGHFNSKKLTYAPEIPSEKPGSYIISQFVETDNKSWGKKIEGVAECVDEMISEDPNIANFAIYKKEERSTSHQDRACKRKDIKSYWDVLFKQETETRLVATYFAMKEKNVGRFAKAQGLSQSMEASMESYVALEMDLLSDRGACLNFPILALVDKWTAERMALFLPTLFDTSSAKGIAKLLSTGAHTNTKHDTAIMVEALPRIYSNPIYLMIWYLNTFNSLDHLEGYFNTIISKESLWRPDHKYQGVEIGRMGLDLAVSEYERFKSREEKGKALAIKDQEHHDKHLDELIAKISFLSSRAGWGNMAYHRNETPKEMLAHFIECLNNRGMKDTAKYLTKDEHNIVQFFRELRETPYKRGADEVTAAPCSCNDIMWELDILDHSRKNLIFGANKNLLMLSKAEQNTSAGR
ncbi:hypothetical protein SYNPS1DRAFT_29328 [Syncephalis pseudoplumigaleata]|nr:hypothetical protein SYNPS1DRAFT_29328 [Syncephalis pseudoplumigaleata]|eukprot:RKP24927.1 hypothetical protein SYNPS1DRAFT_29328 [Syncephalis pseudoplumigaleata]